MSQQLVYIAWRRGALDGAEGKPGSVIARAAGLRSWGAVGAAQARELNESSARLLEPRPECVYAT